MTDLTRAIELLDALTKPGHDPAQPAQPLEAVVLRRMHDAQRGHPGSSMGGGGSHSGASPVEAMIDQPDIGGDALTAWRKAMYQVEMGARTLDRLAMAWAPRQPSAKALRDTERVNTQERLCSICGDEPTIYRSDVNGNLPERVEIGRWCRDFVARVGRAPNSRELAQHKRGGKVMVRT
jgi:hypothetical protein